ncbi:unnamed protein product [Vitrella brassicaformis CCMP3155]|uniref:RING-type domain-containing protein n=1 Tax=Vitrella brassicaformis (strain CCMP3155) TaxID=1169540 RepID=A0A0G4GXF9_VITBC|nr:unnamed protein product [Vitrella brassicaformis CCMP3155]|eukprot:CEM35763.1 unnamed protein product [Vitrella brassicaformis CCMP3155]
MLPIANAPVDAAAAPAARVTHKSWYDWASFGLTARLPTRPDLTLTFNPLKELRGDLDRTKTLDFKTFKNEVLSNNLARALETIQGQFNAPPEQDIDIFTGKKKPRTCGAYGCNEKVPAGYVRWCKLCGGVFCSQHRDHTAFEFYVPSGVNDITKEYLTRIHSLYGQMNNYVCFECAFNTGKSFQYVQWCNNYEERVCDINPYEQEVREHELDDNVAMEDADTGTMLTNGTNNYLTNGTNHGTNNQLTDGTNHQPELVECVICTNPKPQTAFITPTCCQSKLCEDCAVFSSTRNRKCPFCRARLLLSHIYPNNTPTNTNTNTASSSSVVDLTQ